MSADLFGTGDSNTRLGMDFLGEEKVVQQQDVPEKTATGSETTTEEQQSVTGSVALDSLEETQVEDPKEPLIKQPQKVEVTPLNPQATKVEKPIEVQAQTMQTTNTLPEENLHKASAVDVSPVVATQNAFKINTHTVDKVGIKEPLVISQPVDSEVMHSAAVNPVTVSAVTKVPQSGPEENLIFFVSILFSGLAWVIVRRIRR